MVNIPYQSHGYVMGNEKGSLNKTLECKIHDSTSLVFHDLERRSCESSQPIEGLKYC